MIQMRWLITKTFRGPGFSNMSSGLYHYLQYRETDDQEWRDVPVIDETKAVSPTTATEANR